MINMYSDGVDGRDNYVGKYFDWLCELINLDASMYDILIFELYTVDFEWVIDLDSDREYDGIVLRDEFYDGSNSVENLDEKKCSVLEVLIALAKYMNFLLDDDDRGDRTRIWFWEMIDNLGLRKYTNSYLSKPYGRQLKMLNEIRDICNTWMQREFSYSGKGSPFPLEHPQEDQRNLDMIRQLNAYVLENYTLGDELL